MHGSLEISILPEGGMTSVELRDEGTVRIWVVERLRVLCLGLRRDA